MRYDVAIIGGGAAGLYLASRLSSLGVAVIESGVRVGRKLLATGNGRCNLTFLRPLRNDDYNCREAAVFVGRISPDDTLAHFSALGLRTRTEEDRVYPYSLTAASVLDCLRRGAARAGADIFTGARVIAVRKESGKRIRKMFVPADGNVLVCGDYSQIELRLMAHMSGDETMIEAFNEGADFHRSTAAKLFGVPADAVTQDMRRSAKAVNFGIIYGISDFGLSEDLGISVPQARRYMQNYFETYPKVKRFMEDCVAFAKSNGYVRTLRGRKRYIPELQSSVYATRAFGERVAMNMPLQGTASDIIKAAMIDVEDRLEKGGYKAKLIMQVHDELIVDCPKEEKDEVSALLKDCMQNVAKLDVPLIADVGSGDNWLDAK